MLKEFRDFAMRGNVVDLAIGVIIGAAFGKIVDSLVNDIIMPFIGALGGADFSNYFFGLSHAVDATNLVDAKKQGPVFAYGNFVDDRRQFPHRRFRAVPRHQGDQRDEKEGSRRPAAAPAADAQRNSSGGDSRRAGQALTSSLGPNRQNDAATAWTAQECCAEPRLRRPSGKTGRWRKQISKLSDAPLAAAPDWLGAINPQMHAVAESGIVEVFNYGRNRQGLIPLWVGEGDLTTPDFIAEAARLSLARGETFYTYQRGIPELRETIARYMTRVYGAAPGGGAFQPERFFVTVGGMHALQIAMRLIAGPGDEIIVPSPAWPNFEGAIALAGARSVNVPMASGERWSLDIERLRAGDHAGDAGRSSSIRRAIRPASPRRARNLWPSAICRAGMGCGSSPMKSMGASSTRASARLRFMT